MRLHPRVDANHRELLDLARRLGGVVIDLACVGGGCPDAAVFCQRKGWALVEIKRVKGKLTPEQERTHRLAPIAIWREQADVLKHFEVRR